VHDLRSPFDAILEQGALVNPRVEPNGRRGAQHKPSHQLDSACTRGYEITAMTFGAS